MTAACVLLLAGCRGLPQAQAQDAPGVAAMPPTVRDQCAPNALYSVLVLQAPDGRVGAYVLRPRIMDAPIPYLDPDGEPIATFAIFDDDASKQAASAAIDRLRAAYPIEVPLRCPAQFLP